jgi:hypothetical protein
MPMAVFVEILEDEARRIDHVLTEARHISPNRLKFLAHARRALAEAIGLYELDKFPDEGI